MSRDPLSEDRRPWRPGRTRLLPAAAVNREPGTPLRGSQPSHPLALLVDDGTCSSQTAGLQPRLSREPVQGHYNSQRAPRPVYTGCNGSLAGSGCQGTVRRLRPFPGLVLPSSHPAVGPHPTDSKAWTLPHVHASIRALKLLKDANNKLCTLHDVCQKRPNTFSGESSSKHLPKSLDCEKAAHTTNPSMPSNPASPRSWRTARWEL